MLILLASESFYIYFLLGSNRSLGKVEIQFSTKIKSASLITNRKNMNKLLVTVLISLVNYWKDSPKKE